MQNDWEVVVGNLGTVYSGTNGFIATSEYNSYANLSNSSFGRVAGEPVTLFKNGDIHKEYEGRTYEALDC